jgi:hypothetical protein
MTERSGLRPEHVLLLALLLLGGDVLLAVLLLLGVVKLSSWYGVAVLAAGFAASLLVLAYSRKLRRSHRPEWLETQAWRKGLLDKLHQDQPPPREPGDVPEKQRPTTSKGS